MKHRVVLTVSESWQLFQATAILTNCGHGHWFTIKVDELSVETSELGIECLQSGGLK